MYIPKTNSFSFEPEKALELILYISHKSQDLYHLLKIMYFADKEHLSAYGRLISGDSYVAMKNGPVPSQIYDIIKCVRDNLPLFSEFSFNKHFIVDRNSVFPLREHNPNILSASDIECLDKSIADNGHLSFAKLKNKSHDEAFKSADENDFISITEIAKTLKNKDEILDHLKTMY